MNKKQLLKIQSFLSNVNEYEFEQAVNILKNIMNTGILNELLKTENYKNINESRNLYSKNQKFKSFGQVRFKASVSFSKPATAIKKIEISDTKEYGFLQPVLWVNFLGLAGIQGTLPMIYTERVFRNIRDKDNAFASFLDIFNHRILSLFYETNKSIPGYQNISSQDSAIGKILISFGGIVPKQEPENDNNESLKDKNETNEIKNLFHYLMTYRNLFWKKVRSAANLKQIIANFFETRAEIEEFLYQPIKLPTADITRIGNQKGNLNTLGKDAIVGDVIWKQNKKIKITLYDLSYDEYEKFNPHQDGPNFRHLERLAKCYVPCTVQCLFYLMMNQSHKNGVILGQKHFLGFDTWVGSKEIASEEPRQIVRMQI